MPQQNAVLGIPRHTERFAFAGGAYAADYPVANLGLLPLARVARTADLAPASTAWTASAASPLLLRLFMFVRHNFSLAATFRLRLYEDAALSTLLYDSGALDVWPTVFAPAERTWVTPGFWSGKYDGAEIAGQTWARPVWLERGYVAQGLRVDLDDPANPDGFLECGLFEIAEGWQLSVNPAYGAEYGFRFRSSAIEAEGGVVYHARKDKPRRFRGAVDLMARDEVLQRGFEHQRRFDLDQPFVWLPHPDEPLHWLRNAFLARNRAPGPLAYAAFGRDRLPLDLEEVL